MWLAILKGRSYAFFLSTLQSWYKDWRFHLFVTHLLVYIGAKVVIDLEDGMSSWKGQALAT